MFRKLDEGDVYTSAGPRPANIGSRASGSRTALLPDGGYICVFNAGSGAGVNDFTPMAAYSKDGLTWSESKPIWPELIGKESLFVSVRNTADGRISLAGMGIHIAYSGEHWWSDELSAMKENYLVYSLSDDGHTFPSPQWVNLPFYGAAEIPGGMLVDADGSLTFVYSPYPTIEAREEADTCCMVYMRSTDGGKSFESKKIGMVDPPSLYAESWIVRLENGNLLVSTWQTASADAPDQYLLSTDCGQTFTSALPMPFKGQSTSLTPWKDGVLIPYNQRKESPAGVRLAFARPGESGFNLVEDQLVWEAAAATRSQTSGDFSQWTDFSFGEPHVAVMADGTLLLSLWYEHQGVPGIRYVHLAHE